jgi:hypothetical protein
MPTNESVRDELMRDFDEAVKYVTRANMESITDVVVLASIIDRLDDLAWDIQFAASGDEFAVIAAQDRDEIELDSPTFYDKLDNNPHP